MIEGLSGLEREYAAVDAYAGNLAKVGNFGYVCKALVLNPEIDSYHQQWVRSHILQRRSRRFLAERTLLRDEADRMGKKISNLFRARNKRRPTYFSVLKEFFDRGQFFCARPSCSGKPHAQDPARRSNARCDFIEAEIRVFDELSESRDQRPFSGRFSFVGSFFKNHKSVFFGKSGSMSGESKCTFRC